MRVDMLQMYLSEVHHLNKV